MYKNQLQELAQRSCFNLPSYTCIREGPDHAPRFKATVNFNGEIFEAPSYSTTLRQAEHAAAEVALNVLATRGPSRSLAARVLDETGVYKNLLQETAHRAGLDLPLYTTVRSGPGHIPVFTCTVELAGMSFTGEPARTKKQAEKNAAMAAWSSLRQLANLGSSSNANKEVENSEEQEDVIIARVLANFCPSEVKRASKQKEQQQAKRKQVLGYSDNSVSSPSNLEYPDWFLDLLSDATSFYPTQPQPQPQPQYNSLLALTPTLPPTTSRALPQPTSDNHPYLYSLNRPLPVQVRNMFQGMQQEHQRSELSGSSEVRENAIEMSMNGANASLRPSSGSYNRSFPRARAPSLSIQNQLRRRPFNHSPLSAVEAPAMQTTPSLVPNMLNCSRFQLQGMAPPVQIRSVIPVCAASPVRPQSNPPMTQKNEAPSSAAGSSSVCTQTEQHISATSLKFKNLHV